VAGPILVTVLGVVADLIERVVAQGRKPHDPRVNRLRKLGASVLAKRAIPTSVAERSEPLLLLGELVRRLVCPKGRGSYEQHSSALNRKCRSV
jgi:hypothetical protein